MGRGTKRSNQNFDDSEGEQQVETAFEAYKRQKVEAAEQAPMETTDEVKEEEKKEEPTAIVRAPLPTREEMEALMKDYAVCPIYFRNIPIEDVEVMISNATGDKDCNVSIINRKTRKQITVLTPPGYVRYCKIRGGLGNYKGRADPREKWPEQVLTRSKVTLEVVCRPAHPYAKINHVGQDEEVLACWKWFDSVWAKTQQTYWDNDISKVNIRKIAMSETKDAVDKEISDLKAKLECSREEFLPAIRAELETKTAPGYREATAFEHFKKKMCWPPATFQTTDKGTVTLPHTERFKVGTKLFQKIFEDHDPIPSGLAHLIPEVAQIESQGEYNYTPPVFMVGDAVVDPVAASLVMEDGAIMSFMVQLTAYVNMTQFGASKSGVGLDGRRYILIAESAHDPSIWSTKVTDTELDEMMPRMKPKVAVDDGLGDMVPSVKSSSA